jgi:lytic murein transglycosylase
MRPSPMRLARRLIAWSIAVALSTPLAPDATAAVDRPAVETAFQQWIATDLWADATAAGISRATYDRAFAGVALNWDLPELAPPGAPAGAPEPERQAEFRSPAAYFAEDRLDALAKAGRDQMAKWGGMLAAIEKRYGVPGRILVALWARESGYGAAALPYPAIPALATEGFIGRRKDLFRKELLAALQILEAGDIAPERMRSSWAGALGQPQFLPSQFLRYAVDFDGDGKRDIWGSVPDILASMANLLRSQGWARTRGWGLEARVPSGVSCTLEGPDQGKPIAAWAKLGVTKANGDPLPAASGNRIGFLLMPAGRFGPAFVVTENFYALKAYNYSDLYALYIGHLADRFAGNTPFAGKWGAVGGFSRDEVKAMQDRLAAKGYDVGNADGLIGFKTRIAVGLWQAKAGEKATCFPDAKLIKSLQ